MSNKKPSWFRPRAADGRFLKVVVEAATSNLKNKVSGMLPDKAPAIKFGGDYYTSQIYSSGPEFAFMSKQPEGYEQTTPFVYCKDFLHDAIWSLLNNKAYSIYSFKYDPNKDLPLTLDHTALAYRNTVETKNPEDFHARMPSCADFIHQVESVLGFESSEFFQIGEHKKAPAWLILGDAGWQHAPTMISLYTLFIRIGCYHTVEQDFLKTLDEVISNKVKIGVGGAGKNDNSYAKQGKRGIDLILEHGLSIFHEKQADNYPASIKGIMHDSMGIVSFTAQRPKNLLPHWYRKEIWG